MSKVYTHPGQDQMQVEVILASKGPVSPPIYTIRMRYPRIIHGEIMTHRVFSRNARSSRAVPVQTMLNEVCTIPFIPWHWGKNQKGMQADEECNEPVIIPYGFKNDYDFDTPISREEAWLYARNRSVLVAKSMMEAGYHKQIPNRLLEPFSWIDTLITSTDWDNFLWLRDHKDAEPHLQDLARLVKQAIQEADVQFINYGDWHAPYISSEDAAAMFELSASLEEFDERICKLSAARCARISYKPFNGDSSYDAEFARYDFLVSSDRVHASPTEHQAKPDDLSITNNYKVPEWSHSEQHGNFEGYIQARKLILNERYKA